MSVKVEVKMAGAGAQMKLIHVISCCLRHSNQAKIPNMFTQACATLLREAFARRIHDWFTVCLSDTDCATDRGNNSSLLNIERC